MDFKKDVGIKEVKMGYSESRGRIYIFIYYTNFFKNYCVPDIILGSEDDH